jgi:hypothetical protein
MPAVSVESRRATRYLRGLERRLPAALNLRFLPASSCGGFTMRSLDPFCRALLRMSPIVFVGYVESGR